MTYVINFTDPAVKSPISLADQTYDNTSTSLTLTGKGLANYGLFQQQNFLWLLENFADTTPPLNPTTGQLWYNLTLNVPMFWNGTTWDNRIIDSFSGPNPPTSPVIGQLWYDTVNRVLKVYGVAGWGYAQPQVSLGLTDYSPYPDTSTVGLASRLNRVIGSPSTTSGYGWGQTDLVPTYDASGNLTAGSSTAQANLPASNTFPATFDNNAWAIFLSRLRKALRQVGVAESSASPIGFINDGKPISPGNTLANYYNNHDAGPTSYQGTIADVVAGWGGYGSSTVQGYITSTTQALANLETYRYSLGPSQSQLLSLASASRVSPSVSLYVPSSISAYVHTVAITIPDDRFFNAGGQLQFNMSFTPSSGSPTNVEKDWKNFLLAYTGFCLDYQGIKLNSQYLSQSFNPTYQPVEVGGSTYLGYYGIGSTSTRIFNRDVLSTPGVGVYTYDPPLDGGVTVTAIKTTGSGTVTVTINIEYYLQHVTGGTGSTNDTTSTGLNGTMSSNVTAIFASTLNVNSPVISAPTVTQSGTFITAA